MRKPERYCADIFSDLLAGLGIYIGRKSPAPDLPVLQPIASHESAPLNEMLIHMLKYSINLTAEILGVTATRKSGGDASSLTSSARHMQLWAQKNCLSERPTSSTILVWETCQELRPLTLAVLCIRFLENDQSSYRFYVKSNHAIILGKLTRLPNLKYVQKRDFKLRKLFGGLRCRWCWFTLCLYDYVTRP